MKQRIVLLGPPASGKGTQGALIESRLGIEVVSTGSILRQEARRGTALGLEADRLTKDGGMVPDTMVIGLISEWLTPSRTAFAFDGFPRTIAQGDALEILLGERGLPLDIVFFLDVPFEEIEHRVLGRVACSDCNRTFSIGVDVSGAEARCPNCSGNLYRRKDDSPEALERRMREYEQWTLPLVEFYTEKGLLVKIAGAQGAENVFSRIREVLEAA